MGIKRKLSIFFEKLGSVFGSLVLAILSCFVGYYLYSIEAISLSIWIGSIIGALILFPIFGFFFPKRFILFIEPVLLFSFGSEDVAWTDSLRHALGLVILVFTYIGIVFGAIAQLPYVLIACGVVILLFLIFAPSIYQIRSTSGRK